MPADTPRDFDRMLDLDRSTLIRDFVDRIERVMRDAQAAAADMKGILAEAKQQEFAVRDISAMKSVAKLRLDDKVSEARDKLEALQRISRAVGMDLSADG